ncbi:MAG: tetratricopeptide repeat protein [Candidatus Sungbacteria bacterium]|nr:tetratricopeptide repeat protein [Candidatus Sungbacteria bacterium]
MAIDLLSWVGRFRAMSQPPQGVETSEEAVIMGDTNWRRVARFALYAIAFLTPLLFSTLTLPPTLIKQAAVSVLALIAFIAWLGELLLTGRIYYKRSLINAFLLLLLFVLFLSTLFSPQALKGLWGMDLAGERFISFLVLGIIVFIAGGVLRKPEESKRLTMALLWGGFLLSILTLLQLFAPQTITLEALSRIDLNTVGTINALASLLGLFFVLTLALLTTGNKDFFPKRVRIVLYAALVTFLVNLIVINFQPIWIGIIVAVVIILAFKFRLLHQGLRVAGEPTLRDGRAAPLFLILALVTFFFLSGTTLVRFISISPEISPSYKATMDIAAKVLNKSPLLGSGPGTFGIDYSMYRDVSINKTNFWGVRFNNGNAFVPTILATTGVLGALALIGFMLVATFSLLRQIAKTTADDPIVLGGAAATIFGFLMWWLYTSTPAFQVSLFMVIGIVVSRLNETTSAGETRSRWRISERSISFTAPWVTFITSLAIIFFMVGGITLLYHTAQQYLAAVDFTRGVNTLSVKGDVNEAISRITNATGLDSDNDQYYRALAQALLARIQSIVNQAATSPSPNVQNDFQTAVSGAISAAQRATQINPSDSLNWATLGFVYQSIVPFIQGSEQFAVQAYDMAIANDPQSPSYNFSKANTYLALADRAQVLIDQAGQNKDLRDALSKQRVDAIEAARSALEKSTQLKPDYAQANYLLAQVLIRQGNIARAVEKVEAVRASAPFDIGVAFQLGVLYYQSGQFDKAKEEFLRALGLNNNYSNARYFLGLIYDKEGDKPRAIAEFERIEILNPDNQEVKTILQNLKATRPALANISPPGPKPTERKEPPVKDSGGPATGSQTLP